MDCKKYCRSLSSMSCYGLFDSGSCVVAPEIGILIYD